VIKNGKSMVSATTQNSSVNPKSVAATSSLNGVESRKNQDEEMK